MKSRNTLREVIEMKAKYSAQESMQKILKKSEAGTLFQQCLPRWKYYFLFSYHFLKNIEFNQNLKFGW